MAPGDDKYIAWDGKQYVGVPPKGWFLGADNRWWPSAELADQDGSDPSDLDQVAPSGAPKTPQAPQPRPAQARPPPPLSPQLFARPSVPSGPHGNRKQRSGLLVLPIGLVILAAIFLSRGLTGDPSGEPLGDEGQVEPQAEVDGERLDDLDATPDGVAVSEIAALETRWAEARSSVVAEIRNQGYGVTDDVLIGPGNFRVDLGECPSDWRDEPGDGETIVIGQTSALSGAFVSYGDLGIGMEAYIEYVNANGGIGGRPVELMIRDDGYDATQTVEQVGDLLAQVDPFAVMTFGTPNSLAVNDLLNDQCVPHPFAISAHPGLGDPVNHPWTTGLSLSYATEAMLWGEWIRTNLADQLPVTVAALVMDNSFGRIYQQSFERWVDDNPGVVSEFVPVPHDPAAAVLTEDMRTVSATEPDVFIAMTVGNPCLLVMVDADNLGLADQVSARFTSSACRNADGYMVPAGPSADGVLIVDGGLINERADADDPYLDFANETLATAGISRSSLLAGTGFAHYGWPLIEALRIAAELDGGLTRANFLLAQRSIDLDHPAMEDGIRFAMNGAEDGYFIEGSTFSRYEAATDTWIGQGNATDLNGSTPNCQPAADGSCQ